MDSSSNGDGEYKRHLLGTAIPVDCESDSFTAAHALRQPSWSASWSSPGRLHVVREVFPPFLLAGMGMVAAGLLLGEVHHWEAFQEANEMLILIPPLLGLKGNLEMTLAARLSTHANLGHLDTTAQMMPIAVGNIAVVLCQAIVVGFLASVVAVMLDLMTAGSWHAKHLLLVSCSAVTAASTASVLLASMMILIVLLARRLGVNPDNIASPIAGMLGDFCTLGLLAMFAHIYWATHEHWLWVQQLMCVCFPCLAMICARVGLANRHTASVLKEGWTPVIISMLISSMGGVILKHAVQHFHNLAPFAPVTNGAGGNLAAVQASRISTDLHTHGNLQSGEIPATPSPCVESRRGRSPKSDVEPLTPKGTLEALFRSDNEHARTARTLMGLSIPGAFCFVFMIVAVRSKGSAIPDPLFMFLYICAVLLQVCVLFVAAHGIVNMLWRSGINPDNAAIPYVTSMGDLAGTTCLTVAFIFLTLLGGEPWFGSAFW